MMKKIRNLVLAVTLLAVSLTAAQPVKAAASDGEPLQIVATIFPEYDWVLNLLGDNPSGIQVTLLQDSGVDLHSFQPTVEDIMKVASCDLFIYVGGESDRWVADALKETTNPDQIVINLLEALGSEAREEEIVEGMQEEDHSHAHEDEDAEEEETEYDEHVWLSLKNAAALCGGIAQALADLDPDQAAVYLENAAAYESRLTELDEKYREMVEKAPVHTVLFGDRFPFRYMTDDYGLDYYAAFAGCSAETEASFETIAFLAQKVDELSLHTILTIEGTDHRVAETIAQSTKSKDQQILAMDSLQSTTAKEAEAGVTYLSVMEQNLAVLEAALQ